MTIQEALDHCLEDISSGTASVDECLARYPQYASDLRPLLRTAVRLEKVNQVRPSRAFKSRLREQLTGEAPKPRRLFNLRTLVLWTLILLLIAGGAIWLSINSQVAGRMTMPAPLNYLYRLVRVELVLLVPLGPSALYARTPVFVWPAVSA